MRKMEVGESGVRRRRGGGIGRRERGKWLEKRVVGRCKRVEGKVALEGSQRRVGGTKKWGEW